MKFQKQITRCYLKADYIFSSTTIFKTFLLFLYNNKVSYTEDQILEDIKFKKSTISA